MAAAVAYEHIKPYICVLTNPAFPDHIKCVIQPDPMRYLVTANRWTLEPWTMMAKQVSDPGAKWKSLQNLVLKRHQVKDHTGFYKVSLSQVLDYLNLMDGDWLQPETDTSDDESTDEDKESATSNQEKEDAATRTNRTCSSGDAAAGGGGSADNSTTKGNGSSVDHNKEPAPKELSLVKQWVLRHHNTKNHSAFHLGPRLQHTIGKSTWDGCYVTCKDCFEFGGVEFKTLSDAVKAHYDIVSPSLRKKYHKNSWRECEYEDTTNEEFMLKFRRLDQHAWLTE
jgi:hypothetical protein